MATKLKPGSVLKREITVRGIDLPLIFTFTAEGLRVAIKGKHAALETDWPTVLSRLPTTNAVPAAYYQRPLQYLRAQAFMTLRMQQSKSPQK